MVHQKRHSRTSKRGLKFNAGQGFQKFEFHGERKPFESEPDFEEDYRGAKLEIKDVRQHSYDKNGFHVFIDGKLAYVDSNRENAHKRGKSGIDKIREEQYSSV